MTREKAIEVVKSATVYTPKEMEALETLIPELLESEDERIRKGLIDIFNSALGQDFLQRKAGLDRDKVIAYLEKQKEQKSKIDACGFPLRDEGESACSYLERCLSPDMRNIWYEACSEIKEKQKEQKPTGWDEEDENCLECVLWCVTEARHFVAKDACDFDTCRRVERWLESISERLNLQPKQEWKGMEMIMSDTDKVNLRDVPAIIRASNHPFKENMALLLEKYIKR